MWWDVLFVLASLIILVSRNIDILFVQRVQCELIECILTLNVLEMADLSVIFIFRIKYHRSFGGYILGSFVIFVSRYFTVRFTCHSLWYRTGRIGTMNVICCYHEAIMTKILIFLKKLAILLLNQSNFMFQSIYWSYFLVCYSSYLCLKHISKIFIKLTFFLGIGFIWSIAFCSMLLFRTNFVNRLKVTTNTCLFL